MWKYILIYVIENIPDHGWGRRMGKMTCHLWLQATVPALYLSNRDQLWWQIQWDSAVPSKGLVVFCVCRKVVGKVRKVPDTAHKRAQLQLPLLGTFWISVTLCEIHMTKWSFCNVGATSELKHLGYPYSQWLEAGIWRTPFHHKGLKWVRGIVFWNCPFVSIDYKDNPGC